MKNGDKFNPRSSINLRPTGGVFLSGMRTLAEEDFRTSLNVHDVVAAKMSTM